MPERIKRRRSKGWRMPEGARCVSRPSRWGNPFYVVGGTVCGPSWSVVACGSMPCHTTSHTVGDVAYLTSTDERLAVSQAVHLFRMFCNVSRRDIPKRFERWIGPLRGHDLACFCPLDQPCHASVLLELANA